MWGSTDPDTSLTGSVFVSPSDYPAEISASEGSCRAEAERRLGGRRTEAGRVSLPGQETGKQAGGAG